MPPAFSYAKGNGDSFRGYDNKRTKLISTRSSTFSFESSRDTRLLTRSATASSASVSESTSVSRGLPPPVVGGIFLGSFFGFFILLALLVGCLRLRAANRLRAPSTSPSPSPSPSPPPRRPKRPKRPPKVVKKDIYTEWNPNLDSTKERLRKTIESLQDEKKPNEEIRVTRGVTRSGRPVIRVQVKVAPAPVADDL